MHLAGGASFAQRVVALDLVDEFHLFVYPVVSTGVPWFAHLSDKRALTLRSADSFENGVVRLHYVPQTIASTVRPRNFSELLT